MSDNTPFVTPPGYVPPSALISKDQLHGKLDGLLEQVTGVKPTVQGIILAHPGYEELADVLKRAFDQASKGKGKERHAQEGECFSDQVILEGARRFGTGSLLFQAYKKSEESQRLPLERAVNELLGSIIYLAGAVIALEEKGS